MPTEQITVYANIEQIEAMGDIQSLTLTDFNIDQITSEFPVKEIIESLIAQDKFSEVVDIVTKEMEEENDNGQLDNLMNRDDWQSPLDNLKI